MSRWLRHICLIQTLPLGVTLFLQAIDGLLSRKVWCMLMLMQLFSPPPAKWVLALWFGTTTISAWLLAVSS
jgi:hypothetical protein